MPNPYPATFEVAENLHVRLDGDVTFTDPANQPGGGGGGQVNTVTAGDASITIAGTVTDPTVAVAALGVTSGKIASNAVTQAKLAAKAVGAAEMDSGVASANWVPVADGTGGVVYAASPGVNSLTAADASVVVGGTASSPTVRTGTLDTIATQHPPTAAVALNSQKITGLANGTLASDAAAFGQIPTALPPNGSAGGDLSGTYPNPTVAAVQGVAVSGTAPTANQVLTASDATHAAWATPSGSSPLTTKGDVYGFDTANARIPVGTDGQVLTADSAQSLGVKWAAVSGGSTDGWTSSSDTWTYASATTFTISGVDRTAQLSPGTRLKLTQTTTKYFVVASSVFSTNTTVTITGGSDYSLANASITSPFYSYEANPQGYPGWFNFAAATTGITSDASVTRFCVNGRAVIVALKLAGTSNATSKAITLPITPANIASFQWICPLTVKDAGTVLSTPGEVVIDPNNASASVYKNTAAAAWTATGSWFSIGEGHYEI